MAVFAPNTPVIGDGPLMVVDPGLPPGQHTFKLEVEDDLGQRSVAVQATVNIDEPIIITGPVIPTNLTPTRR